MDFLANISPFLGFGGLAVAWFIYKEVRDRPDGNDRMREIAGYIYEGAIAFLKREYRILGYFVLIVFVLLTISISWRTAIAFVSGASCSVLAGLFGMQAATKANVRTSQAAKDQGEGEALLTAFDGGAVMGLSVASLELIGVGFFLWLYHTPESAVHQRLRHGCEFNRVVRPRRWRNLHEGGGCRE